MPTSDRPPLTEDEVLAYELAGFYVELDTMINKADLADRDLPERERKLKNMARIAVLKAMGAAMFQDLGANGRETTDSLGAMLFKEIRAFKRSQAGP